jgi:predicted outer membrane repeat protein
VACVSASENQTSIESSDINDVNAIDAADEDINEYYDDMSGDAGENTSEGQITVSGNMLSSGNVDDRNATLDVADNGAGAVSGDLLSGSDADYMLSASKEGTRDELYNLVLAAKPGSTVTLDKDYRFLVGVKTIEITKSIVIDGNGHTILLGYNPAFEFKYLSPVGKIELKNITFSKGIGSAIIFGEYSCPFTISNCRFIDCSSNNGGALSGKVRYNSNIVNCTFKGCYGSGDSKVSKQDTISGMVSGAWSTGGAMWIEGPVTVKSCRFEGCSAGNGGAITIYGNCQVIDCVFVKNYGGRTDSFQASAHGGAIHISGGVGALVKGCTFNENHVRCGGAIAAEGSNVRIEDCVFNSNYADKELNRKGAAIYVRSDIKGDETSIVITRCAFNNNGYNDNKLYCKEGGAIYFSKGIVLGTVSYCNFTGNGASNEGGAVYASSDCRALSFTGCIFTKNKAGGYGGAIYLDSKTSTIYGCAFVDQPNAVYCDNKQCNVKFSTFLRNDNYDIWSTKQISIVSNWFGNTMDNRYMNLAKLKGKAIIINNFENLYLVATSMDKNYYSGQESAVNLVLKYIRESPTDDSKLSSSGYSNPAIRYVVSGVNASVVSSNLYLANGKSTFKFNADPSKSASSVTVDCYGAKITLRFKSNPNSFTALQSMIDSSQNGVLNLTHSYTRDKSIDGDMSISILKNLVINGNGHTVDSKNIGGVFKIDKSVNVEINDLNIVNCQSDFGAAIHAYADRIAVNNCSFVNCSAKFEGGAIKMAGNWLTINNSTFINNTVNENGGSLFVTGVNTIVRDCIFLNSNAGGDGCLIYLGAHSRLNLTDSIFLTHSAAKYIAKPSGDNSLVNVTVNIENNWFGGTNDNILKNYNMLNNFTVKSLLYLNAAPSAYNIPVGNSSIIGLKFYSYDLNSRRSVPLANFRNMKFRVSLSKEGGTLSSNSIILTNNEGSVVYTSSSNGMMPIDIDYELVSYRIYINQFYDGSFTALQYLINNSGDVINLTRDYTFSAMADSLLTDGIYINKDLTINGNNHVVNGNEQARIFNIAGHKVVLNNITFINGKADNGGAVLTSKSAFLSIDSCSFENNSANNGGALYLESKSTNIESSVFKNNNASAIGGAIYYYQYYQNNELCNITGTFINNRAGGDAGAIYLMDLVKYRLNGNFINNTAGGNGGAVYSDSALIIPTLSIEGIFDSNAAGKNGGAVFSFNPSGNFTGIYQNNRASQDGGALYTIRSSTRYGMPYNISGEFYSNSANGQGSAVCAMNLERKDVNLYESIFMKNNGKSIVYSSGYAYLYVHDSIFVDNGDARVFDTSQDGAVDGRLRAYNNWFGNTVDNVDRKPSVGARVVLNDWLFVDVDSGKTETYLNSRNDVTFVLKSYDAKKGTVSDYKGDFKLNLNLKSDKGNLSIDSFVLGNVPVNVTYVTGDYGENNVVVLANMSKYSYKTYEIKYNVVDHPVDSFYALQYEIDHMEGNVLNLNYNYEFYPEIDNPNGIKINKSITINGNGFIIDAKGGSRIFNILADDVVVENLSLINGNDIDASAIYAEGNNITIRNSILLNNSDVVIYAAKSLNANYNWWGNTVDTFNRKANVSGNVVVDNALFVGFSCVSNVVGAGKNATLTLNLTNLHDFNLESNSTYDGLNLFAFDFNAVGGNVNVTSDSLNEGIIHVSFEAMGPLYGEVYAIYEDVVLKYEFEVIFDDDSFTALYDLINKTQSGGVVNLTHDYKFYYYDVDYVNGIPIDKAVTINGNGFDVSGMNESCIFVVSADNVSLININIYDSLNAVEWLGNNGVISNVSFNDSFIALNCYGSNMVVRDSNFTRANFYSVYIEGSNHVVYNCSFVDNFGSSIIAHGADNLNIEDSTFNNIYSTISGIVEIGDCKDVNITGCIFNNQNNESISIMDGSTVYLFNNNLSKSDYIFNNGTILSRTFVSMDDVNLSYMVGDVVLLKATIYDDNGNVILVDEFYFNIGENRVRANLNIDVYEYSWILTNGTWFVVPDISEKSLANCTVDSAIVNVLKYNSSVNITSISYVVYGEDVNIRFEFENSTSVLVTIIFGSDVVFTEITDARSISISDLNTGFYDVIISTIENEFFKSSNVTSEFIVDRAGSSVTLEDVGDIYYGEDLIINFTVENRTSVIASVYDVENREFIFNGDIEGDSLIINDLPVGSYSITLTNIIGPNHNPSGDFALFKVLKVNSSINLDDKTEYIYDNVLINYDVDNLTYIMVTVVDLERGDRDSFITTNSTISLDLDAGYYQITLVNVETDDVFASQDSKTFFVLPANSSVEIEDMDDVYYGEDIEIFFNVVNATNVTVVVKNENDEVIYQNNTNESYFDLSDLAVGEYTVEVYNWGSDNFNPSNDSKTFNVLKAGSFIQFEYLNVIYYGMPFRLDYDVENETLLNIRIYDSKGNVIYDKNFNEICEIPEDMEDLTEEAYLGDYFFVYRNLTVGNYGFEFTNLGNSNVSGDNVNGSFEIIKAPSYVEVFTDSINYGEDLEVYICVFNATIVNVMIEDVSGGIVYNENVTSSPVIVSNLLSGMYTVTVTNYGTENVIGNSSSQVFYVFKLNSTVKLNNVSDIHYEDDVLIDFDVDNRTIVNVMIQNQDGEVVYDSNVTVNMLWIPDLNVGNYTVTVTNLETFNISQSSDSKSFKVLKRSANIAVVVEDNVYGELSVINVISDIDDILPVNVGNQQLFVGVADGHGKVMVSLDAGNYTAYVNYTNDNYDISMTNCSFVVSKADVALSVEVLDKVYTADITGNVFAGVDGEYTVVVNEHSIPVAVLNGVGAFDLGIMDVGNYNVRVIFAGNDNYNGNVNESTFEVARTGTNFNIIANAINITYGDSINVTQSLPEGASGNITYFLANGSVIKVLNVGKSFVMPILDVGTYVVYANYSGDSNYAPARDSFTVTVNKAINNIIVSGMDVVYLQDSAINVVADVDGDYTVVVGGKIVLVTVLNGVGMNVTSLDAGTYTADVEFVHINYKNNVTSIPFNVAKAEVVLSVEVLDKVYTADITGNVFASVDGEYTVVVGDDSIPVIVLNGVGAFNFGIMDVGNYTVHVIFAGNENYNENENVSTFNVTATGTNFNIIPNASEITYGDAINIAQGLPAEATGSVAYRFANGTIIKVIDVSESFVLSGLDAGSYVVYANYSGDSNYASALDSVTIVVNKAINNVVVSASDVIYPNNVTLNVNADIDGVYIVYIGGTNVEVNVVDGKGNISVSLVVGKYGTLTHIYIPNYVTIVSEAKFSVLAVEDYDFNVTIVDKTVIFSAPSDAVGNVTLVVGNTTHVVSLVNGSASITVPELVEGLNAVKITYSGDAKYAPRVYSTELTVNTKIIASDMTCAYNSGLYYQVKIVDNNGNPLKGKKVEVTVNKKTYSLTTDDNGIGRLKVDLPVGTYKVTITVGDCGKTVTKTIKVVKRFTGNKNIVKYYNSNYKYKFRVIGDNGKAVGKGVKVTVKIGKRTYTFKTDNNGYITIKLTKKYVPKKYTITATYKGYTIKNTIKVKQVLSAKNFKVKKSAKKLVLTAKLKQGKKALKNKRVTFKFKGKKYKAKTNKKGVAKVTIKKKVIKKLKAGKKYKFTVTYLKDTIKRNVKVKR